LNIDLFAVVVVAEIEVSDARPDFESENTLRIDNERTPSILVEVSLKVTVRDDCDNRPRQEAVKENIQPKTEQRKNE
jgi:hypothetical protein